MTQDTAAGELVEPIAVAMISSYYLGMFLLVGFVLLGSCLLPFQFLRRARMIVGALFIVAAATVYLWMTMYYGG